jgi:galactonate dehydratase
MKIVSITPYVAGHWVLVSVLTDEGTRGSGEATYFTHPLACAQVVRELADQLVGHDPFRTEYHAARLLKTHCVRDSAEAAALSAIDQALWDIKGQALGVPVWQLLGGRVRDRVRAIVLVEATTAEDVVEQARVAVADGFTAMKIKPFVGDWGRNSMARVLRDAADLVAEVRTVIGWEVDLAVEVHRNLVPADAEVFGRLVADQLLYFLEDPILPFSTSSNTALAGRLPMPVAIAERNTNIWEYREFSDSPDVAFLRPDVGLAGGFTGLQKIAAIAESRHQRIIPHNFTSPIVTACHVQLAACTNNWDLQGYVREQREPWTSVVDRVNTVHDGFLEIPETPGIGMRLDLDFLETAEYVPFGNKFLHGYVRSADGGVRHQ